MCENNRFYAYIQTYNTQFNKKINYAWKLANKEAKTCSAQQHKSYCLKNKVVIDGPFTVLSNVKGYKN